MLTNPNAEKKLFLLDAYALIYRAYFAFINNPRVSSKGLNTSAMFGFTTGLYDMIRTEKPTHVGVVFDPAEEKSERSEVFEFYKANRQEMPEDIRISIPYIVKILGALHIPCLVVEGYEADDVVGTLAKQAEALDFYTYMMTSDKDYGQLVTRRTFWYRPGRMGSPSEVLGIEEVCKKFQVENTAQVIDILGLMGDAVDNIPGIPGVGEKTAQKLIQEFGSIENMLANTHTIKGKLREKVEQNAEMALMSKKLATIITDVPIDIDEEQLRLRDPDREKLKELFAELEFRTLSERILGESLNAGSTQKPQGQMGLFDSVSEAEESPDVQEFKKLTDIEHQYFVVDDPNWRKDLLEVLLQQQEVCIDTETTDIEALNASIVGISFCYRPHQAFYIPLPADNREEARKILNEFLPFFHHEGITKIGQNIKYDLTVLSNYQIRVKGNIFDTMLAHYVIQPDLRHNMDFLSETYLHYKPIATEEIIGPKGKNQKNMKDVEVPVVAEYCNEDTDVTLQLKKMFQPMLDQTNTRKVFEEVEMPIVPVLAAMEAEGIRIDTALLKSLSDELAVLIEKTDREVQELAGVPFNSSSPKQLGEILFDHLKLDAKAKKTRTGQYSTNEETLQKLAGKHPIIEKILELREIQKLKSTYVDALPALINPRTGRVHTSFNQAVAATGRLSSNNPNLQNIPIRTERGREIRKAFIPRDESCTILSADYSQVELRIIAELSKETHMIEAFRHGMDIHTATAARVFGVSPEEVTKEMRGKAKMVNFGIIYGISPFGLAQRLNIPRGEAAEIIDNYFTQYPGIRKYMDAQINFAREMGYVETIMGRRRYLKDINSANFTVKGFAERNAINAPIQGSAADIIKLAMIRIHHDMQEQQMKSRMVLQVHDELVFDASLDELEPLQQIVRERMENAVIMEVPLVVEMSTGNNWLEAH